MKQGQKQISIWNSELPGTFAAGYLTSELCCFTTERFIIDLHSRKLKKHVSNPRRVHTVESCLIVDKPITSLWLTGCSGKHASPVCRLFLILGLCLVHLEGNQVLTDKIEECQEFTGIWWSIHRSLKTTQWQRNFGISLVATLLRHLVCEDLYVPGISTSESGIFLSRCV